MIQQFLQTSDDFLRVFHTRLIRYLHIIPMRKGLLVFFNVFSFEDYLQPVDGESMEMCVRRRYGDEGVELMYRVFSIDESQLL